MSKGIEGLKPGAKLRAEVSGLVWEVERVDGRMFTAFHDTVMGGRIRRIRNEFSNNPSLWEVVG